MKKIHNNKNQKLKQTKKYEKNLKKSKKSKKNLKEIQKNHLKKPRKSKKISKQKKNWKCQKLFFPLKKFKFLDIYIFFFPPKKKREKKCYYLSFAKWGDKSLTRPLQSTPFLNPCWVPWALRQSTLETKKKSFAQGLPT